MYLHTLVGGLPHAERAALVQASELRSYGCDETVLATGEWTDRLYCVASGLLRVVVQGRSSSGDVTTDLIRQDEFFLGPSLSESRYRARQTLVAAQPSSVYLVPVSAMRGLCEQHPQVAVKLLGAAIKRMSAMRGQLRRDAVPALCS
ncbi:cyclic nucleotide-binding domain-containing protein [Variovorax paradoxus B4]|uniref:Cyclic nucleotide-binding domain protein n=2 Tax=Variovorax paradoxus TaxID=34073 RepID=A0A0H2M221_VARPD|nr:cyclic nucleotide-binding domain-containing protein [Variovorax paradoxus]AGU49192.1 cyclic nucleotide-binding domain-containing protein [Variovorax paradoxus B4]KLN56454.1 cyclic nucleotide-binding domain protein [Variovorax paradoxus]